MQNNVGDAVPPPSFFFSLPLSAEPVKMLDWTAMTVNYQNLRSEHCVYGEVRTMVLFHSAHLGFDPNSCKV